jgi:hypothetical protein
MDLITGFQLSAPPKVIPWRINNLELEDLFDGYALKKVKHGYYTLKCEPLQGLHCVLGFHLHEYDVLTELEFFKPLQSEADIAPLYAEFQHHFETEFGPPKKTEMGTEGFPSYEWTLPGAKIIHLVRERFGPEQRMRIIRQ